MLEIRKATEEDAAELAVLDSEFNGDTVRLEHIIECLENNREIIAVASLDSEIIGFACAQYFKSFCYEDLQGEITELYVREEFRRMGAASALISYLERQLNSIGVEEIKIITNARNDVAKSVYESRGYRLKNWVVLVKQ